MKLILEKSEWEKILANALGFDSLKIIELKKDSIILQTNVEEFTGKVKKLLPDAQSNVEFGNEY